MKVDFKEHVKTHNEYELFGCDFCAKMIHKEPISCERSGSH